MKATRTIRGALLTTAIAAVALTAQPAFAENKGGKKDRGGETEQSESGDKSTEKGGAAQQQSSERPFDPLGGRIRTFEGEVDTLGGRIRTFGGDLQAFVGRIRTFDGDIESHGGRIRTFEGDLDPFKGNIRAFWGDLTPEAGELDPKVGRIRTFSDDFLSKAGNILALWEANNTKELGQALSQMIAEAKAEWEDEILAETGLSFEEAFADEFFEKWGLDLSNLKELETWDAYKRQAFMLDWYDNLLNYSGMDQVDHWMNAVNWNPAITQVQGGGESTTIGVLDFFAARDPDVLSKTVYAGGYQNVNDGHGAAVSSLLVSSHDGKGIMGIAPNATIAGYNPFDETLTASWEDVRRGLIAVGDQGASVVNLSLGVSGYTLPDDWRDLFNDPKVEAYRDNTIYVIAAGNDGITQTEDVEFGGALDTTFIVVGSVDPNGQISDFSNRPGEACLLKNGTCENGNKNLNGGFGKKHDYLREGGLLKNRFLVAPGEMILTSDGHGGVTRVSGTSFAAPLVTGAIALIHDRWPWLRDHPFDVAKAILESAQDLGEPGVDDVYGWGLLDIEASQSALDFNNLQYYLVDQSGSSEAQRINRLRKSGMQSSWEADEMYFVAFEGLVESDRDFLIPLSTRLFNTSVNGQTMQEFMYHRFAAWMNSGAPKKKGFNTGFSDLQHTPAMPIGGGWNFSVSGTVNMVSGNRFLERPDVETTVQFDAPSGAFGFAVGHGDASALVGGQTNLGLTTDYNPVTGGANPLIGFAAGGAHVAGRARLAQGLNLSLAVTNRDGSLEENVALEDFGLDDRALIESRGDYKAMSTTVRLDYKLSEASTLSMAVTMLDEQDALFGVRSIEPTDFADGVRTTGLTVAADFDLGSGLSLFGSATGSRSNASGDANLQVSEAFSTAFQVGMAKHGLLGKDDKLRLTVAQPLTLESGAINAQMIGVIDRQTGEKGIINERFDLSNTAPRRYVAEGHYSAPMFDGAGQVSLFARAELRPEANFSEQNSDFLGGVRFRVAF